MRRYPEPPKTLSAVFIFYDLILKFQQQQQQQQQQQLFISHFLNTIFTL